MSGRQLLTTENAHYTSIGQLSKQHIHKLAEQSDKENKEMGGVCCLNVFWWHEVLLVYPKINR